MSGKIRQRGSANTEKALNPMNTNERILKVRAQSSLNILISTIFYETKSGILAFPKV